jgi:hypothetical protein
MYWISTSYQTKLLPFVGITVTNFGGAARKGTNNVFAKLMTSDFKMNIQGTGCAAPTFCTILSEQVLIFYQFMLGPQRIKYSSISTYILHKWKNYRNFVTLLILNTNRFSEV